MKNLKFVALFTSCFVLFACGGGSEKKLITATGPDLDIAELISIRVDQLKFTGGLEDDSALDGVPEAALYIRCADSDVDIACAGASQGLDIIKKSGVAYGRIDAKFEAVQDVSEDNCFDVKLLFVEKDSDDCPAKIDEDDDILWTSSALTLSEDGIGSFLNSPIASEDGSLAALLVGEADELADDLTQATTPQDTYNLKIDQLYFKLPVLDESKSFKLIVKSEEGEAFRCESAFTTESSGVEREDVIYGNLGLALLDNAGNECLVTDANKMENILISLYVSGSDQVLTTENPTTVLDLVDNDNGKEMFGETGFVRFVPINGVQ